jgi:hypothetical protein
MDNIFDWFGAWAVMDQSTHNLIGAEKLTFSTTEILSFVFGIALSAASTVLAVVAIQLGKASEQETIRRSDEAIRLQQDVFAKTVEALSRIQSSTGVTEKRIEDIISGRVGSISQRLADTAYAGGSNRFRSKEALEHEFRRTLAQELGPEPSAEQKEEEEEEGNRHDEALAAFQAFHQAVLIKFTNHPEVTTEKIGDGSFNEKGDALVCCNSAGFTMVHLF